MPAANNGGPGTNRMELPDIDSSMNQVRNLLADQGSFLLKKIKFLELAVHVCCWQIEVFSNVLSHIDTYLYPPVHN